MNRRDAVLIQVAQASFCDELEKRAGIADLIYRAARAVKGFRNLGLIGSTATGALTGAVSASPEHRIRGALLGGAGGYLGGRFLGPRTVKIPAATKWLRSKGMKRQHINLLQRAAGGAVGGLAGGGLLS